MQTYPASFRFQCHLFPSTLRPYNIPCHHHGIPSTSHCSDSHVTLWILLTVRLCMGGLTVLGAGTLPISFFSDSVKIMRFYDCSDICFLNICSNFTSMSYKMNFWRCFYYMYPCFRSSCCSGEAFHPAVSAAHSCMRDVKWSL